MPSAMASSPPTRKMPERGHEGPEPPLLAVAERVGGVGLRAAAAQPDVQQDLVGRVGQRVHRLGEHRRRPGHQRRHALGERDPEVGEDGDDDRAGGALRRPLLDDGGAATGAAAEAASVGLERGAPVMDPTLDRAPAPLPVGPDAAGRHRDGENRAMRVISANVNGIRAAVAARGPLLARRRRAGRPLPAGGPGQRRRARAALAGHGLRRLARRPRALRHGGRAGVAVLSRSPHGGPLRAGGRRRSAAGRWVEADARPGGRAA